ncbi:MAG: hypothetical protein P8Y40_11115 [Desulfobacterales bacterium]
MSHQPDDAAFIQQNGTGPPLFSGHLVIDKVFLDLLSTLQTERPETIARANIAKRERKIQAIHIKKSYLLSSLAKIFRGAAGDSRKNDPAIDFFDRYDHRHLIWLFYTLAKGEWVVLLERI